MRVVRESPSDGRVGLAVPPMARALIAALALILLAAAPAAATAAPATDGPGALSHFDLARKDCLGTSRTTSSKVWYTVAGGALSDVYYPTMDNTNVQTLQYIVSDGSSFTSASAGVSNPFSMSTLKPW